MDSERVSDANDFPFHVAGDVCPQCAPMWENQNLPPKSFVPVLDSEGQVIKTDKGIEIVACPYCDGGLLFELPKSVSDD